MNQTVERIQTREEQRQTLHPFIHFVAGSDLAQALVYSAGAVVGFSLILWALGWEYQSILKFIARAIGLGFLLVSLSRFGQLLAKDARAIAAIAEALAEIAIQRDLNDSGEIGDYKLIEQPEARDTPTDTRAAFMRHVQEFRDQVANNIRDVTRDSWLAHKGKDGTDIPAYQWSDGESITRPEYDQITAFLTSIGEVKGRRKGRKGEVQDPPTLSE